VQTASCLRTLTNKTRDLRGLFFFWVTTYPFSVRNLRLQTLLYWGLFTEITTFDIHTATPIYGVMPLLYITLKTAVFPISHTLYISMLDWVVMNVINMSLQIIIISNLVFLKPSLPYAFFSALGFAVAALLIDW
jgi:hypothetical protein